MTELDLGAPATVSAYFTRRLPEFSSEVERVEVNSVMRLSRGVSRETWQVDATVHRSGDRRRDESFMVRRDPPVGSVIPVGLREEYEVYRRLTGTPVPTAEALWFEDDTRWQADGRPLYVRRHVEGTWDLPALRDDSPGGDATRVALSKEHLRKLALVHTTDWRSAGFAELYPVPDGPEACATTLIDFLLARVAAFKFEPAPVVAAAVARLRRDAPKDAPAIALCKGTNGLGEEVWRDGKIVAMSDWELCGVGDPASDFAQLQGMIPKIERDGVQIWGWEPALAYYEQLTGWAISMSRIRYYRRLHGLILYQLGHHAAHLVCRGGAHSPRAIWTATEMQYLSQRSLARTFTTVSRIERPSDDPAHS